MSRDLEQGRKLDSKATSGAGVDVDAEHDPEVARRASNAGLRREVQKKGSDGIAAGQVHAAAERGAATPAGPLPHMDKIQASFGAHDVSGIQAHVDGKSTRAMGAEAYASGNHVVFGRQPGLHTAAHEAAHVVQQAKGVNVKGGVGAEGAAHERQADEVADRVVAGKPAGDLLGPVTARPAPGQAAVQRKPAEKTADPTNARSNAAITRSGRSSRMHECPATRHASVLKRCSTQTSSSPIHAPMCRCCRSGCSACCCASPVCGQARSGAGH